MFAISFWKKQHTTVKPKQQYTHGDMSCVVECTHASKGFDTINWALLDTVRTLT